ncbi:unnamed protein product [Prunus armeniaca]
MSELRENISELKSSLAKKDSELNSSAATLESRKNAYFLLERKNANFSHSYDKILAEVDVYHKVAKHSKSGVFIDACKLGYLDYTFGTASCYAIGDEDIETLCLDLFLV